MKRTLLAIVAITASVGVLAQGQISFANDIFSVPPTAEQPNGAVVGDMGGVPIDGAAGWAQLYAPNAQGSYEPVGAAVNFLTGSFAGYFAGGVRNVPNVVPGASGMIDVRAWLDSAGQTYEAAVATGINYGMSGPFEVATGGAGSPPSVPGNMTAMPAFNLVPEPSTTALGVIGAFALLLRRRK